MKTKTHILFVCLGNICRSTAAEAILTKLTSQNPKLVIESAAVGHWCIGEPPDPRQMKACAKKDYTFCPHKRARLIKNEDFDTFDYILSADESVFRKLKAIEPKGSRAKIEMMTAYSPKFKNQCIPDPYYKNEEAFDLVVTMLEDSCLGFLEHLKE